MSVARITAIVLPQMVSSKGIIINISSVTDKRPYPLLSAYSASEAFVRSFSLAVGAEHFSRRVIVQVPDRGGGAPKKRSKSGSSEGEEHWHGGTSVRTVTQEGFNGAASEATVSPCMVDTDMTHPVKFRQLLANSEDFARQALDTLGLTSQTSGCFSHAIQGVLLDLLLPIWFALSRWGVKHLFLLWIYSDKRKTLSDKRP
ncbi:very-long-chain 3-oxoacyl-CoA reductase-like [Hipposideros larvatus]